MISRQDFSGWKGLGEHTGVAQYLRGGSVPIYLFQLQGNQYTTLRAISLSSQELFARNAENEIYSRRNEILAWTILLKISNLKNVSPHSLLIHTAILRSRSLINTRPTLGEKSGCKQSKMNSGEQGWCSGESTRLPPMRPGSIPAGFHMRVEFVVGFHLAPRVFLWSTGFLPSTKTSISKFQFNQDRGPA